MVMRFRKTVLPWTLFLVVLHWSAGDDTESLTEKIVQGGRSSRSLQTQPLEKKHTKDLREKSIPLHGNKTRGALGNGTYWVEDDTPTQPLRNTAKEEVPPPSPVEEGVNDQQPKELPIALIIASPVVAVFIIVFVCVAYYCHSAQLDARARELAMRMKADAEMAQVMVQAPRQVIIPQDNTDMEAEHTSLRSVKTQTSSESKRGSVIEDREVIKYSRTRRHSTFII